MTLLIELVKENNFEKILSLLRDGEEVNEENSSGNTALHYAAEEQNLEILDLLIEKGGSVNAQNKLGESPLMIAAVKRNIHLVERLLEKGANPNIGDKDGYTSLHKAALFNKFQIIQLLTKYQGDISLLTNSGSSIMHCVAVGVTEESEDWELAKWLLSQGVDYKAIDSRGCSVYGAFSSKDWSYADHFKQIVMEIVGEEIKAE